MWLRFFVFVFLLTAISGQKGGRQASASDGNPSFARSPSRALAQRKLPQPSEPIQQVQEPDDRDPEEDKNVVSAVRPTRPSRPVPLPRPQPSEPTEVEGHYPAPEPYSFSYQVDDPETGAASSREETQDANGEVVGYYHIKDAEGRTRRVDYTAGKDGFKATIKSNEEGLNARAPADVNIELSASPSELQPSIALNNRPTAAESSIKSFGKPPSERFFQRLVAQPPNPVPAPSNPQPLEQTPEQIPDDTQISQNYETSDSDTSETDPREQITQQKTDDEEITFESAPVKGGPVVSRQQASISVRPLTIQHVQTVQPVQTIQPSVASVQQPLDIAVIQPQVRPIERQVISTTPARLSQSFREQGQISLQAVPSPQPIAQVREDISHSIQDVRQSVQPLSPAVLSQPVGQTIVSTPSVSFNRQSVRPVVSPILGGTAQVVRPVGSVSPQFTQFFHQGQVASGVSAQPVQTQAVQLTPPSSNIIVQSEHRQPVSRQHLINILGPVQTSVQTQVPTVTIDETPPQVIIQEPVHRPGPVFSTITPSVTYVPEAPKPQEIITQQKIETSGLYVNQPLQREVSIHENAEHSGPHPVPVIRQPQFHFQPILPVWAQQQQLNVAQGRPLTSPVLIEPAARLEPQVVQTSQLITRPAPTLVSQQLNHQIVSQPVATPVVTQPVVTPIVTRPVHIVNRPAPAPQRQELFDEPQVYEPASRQTYDPIQQSAEDPAEESRAGPPAPTDCGRTAEARNDPVKGSASTPAEASEPAPVKGERISSPVRNALIPRAFRSK